MKRLFTGIAAGALAISIFSSSAFAAVTFDSSTGTGFVGKGDVQTVMGWNNKQLQDNADSLDFTYTSIDTYEITVEWITGDGTPGKKTHTVEHIRTANVRGDVAYDVRRQNQVTGFHLEGTEDVTESGSVPEEGDIFPGNSGHKVTDVKLVSSISTLYVNGKALQ